MKFIKCKDRLRGPRPRWNEWHAIDHVIFSVKNVHASACSLKVLRASPGPAEFIASVFPPCICVQLAGYVLGIALLLFISYDDSYERCV